MRTLICIPTYDEEENLARLVARLRGPYPEVDLLIVDDSSPDGTDLLASRDARVHVLHRPARSGLGRAYLEAFAWALRHGYECVVEMDADGSHRPEDLAGLLDAVADGADLALGSRWMPGGAVRDWALHRVLLSRAGNRYARILLGLPYGDVTGGFRAFRADRLPLLDLGAVRSEGYCFQIDLVRRAHAAGLRIAEVPITFVEREHGTSKTSGRIVLEALRNVTRWGLAGPRAPLAARARERLPGPTAGASAALRRP